MLKIAIISDVHAHKYRHGGINSSIIISDQIIDKPSTQNPILSLHKLITENKIKADFLLMPGDFCDQSDKEGFQYVWNELKSIGGMLGVSDFISTIGNHDVLRGKGKDTFSLIKSIDVKLFPSLKHSARISDLFWEEGYCIINYPILDTDILVINSSFHHTSDKEIDKGKISIDQLSSLRDYLIENSKATNKIAMTHHPTILHERLGSKSFDIMEGGSELMEIIDEIGFRIFIYGHKHDARIKYSNSGAGSAPIFSSGSFACVPDLMLPGAQNSFHIITLEDSIIENCENQGFVETYYFIPSKGWKMKNTDYFPGKIGFGCTATPDELAIKTFNYLKANTLHTGTNSYMPLKWEFFIKAVPEVEYLIPSIFQKFGKICKEKYGILFSTELPQNPEVIHLNIAP